MVRAVITSSATSGHTNFRAPTPVNGKVIGVGCSGSDPVWNRGGTMSIVGAVTGTTPQWAIDTIPGAPIHYHEDHFAGPPQTWAWQSMPDFEFMHLGDNPGLQDFVDIVVLNRWAQKFWSLGNGGAGGEILQWTMQPTYAAGEALTSLLNRTTGNQAICDAAQDYANARVPVEKKLVRQVPGLALCRRFLEDQIAGTAPSPAWFTDLYADDFHMQPGKIAYIASVVSAATMYAIDPAVMPNTMPEPTGFTTQEAVYVRSCASAVVKAHARAGVNTSAWQ